MRANELLHRIRIFASGSLLQFVEILWRRNREDGRIDHGAAPLLPIRRDDPDAETAYAHHCVRGIGGPAVGRVEASHYHRILARNWNTCALESAEPLPLASNVPVKQMPLAWLRRCPSAGPPGGAERSYQLGWREPIR